MFYFAGSFLPDAASAQPSRAALSISEGCKPATISTLATFQAAEVLRRQRTKPLPFFIGEGAAGAAVSRLEECTNTRAMWGRYVLRNRSYLLTSIYEDSVQPPRH